ncbi:MAG: ComF family protein [Deltaproteobacteria bacterium]|nr:ComF family protein [Deltaproteobacteria bacterium]
MRRLLGGARTDLSAAAIRNWSAYGGEECPRCGAFTGSNLLRTTPSSCPSCAACPPFDFARSLFVYGGCVREGIRAAKYGRRPVAAEALGERLFEAIRGKWSDRFPDAYRPTVIPVPIRPMKYFHRGFNLPALVGRALAALAGWPYSPLLLRRSGGDSPQAGLRLDAREENVREAFRVPAGARMPACVLLLDDVYTSGATAAACARALKTAGAGHIVVLTAARAVL